MSKRKEKPQVPDYRESKGKKLKVAASKDTPFGKGMITKIDEYNGGLGQLGFEKLWAYDRAEEIKRGYAQRAFGGGGYTPLLDKTKEAKLDLAIELLHSAHPQLLIAVDTFQPGDYVSVRCEADDRVTEYRVSGSALVVWDVPELVKNLVKGLRLEEAYPEFPDDSKKITKSDPNKQYASEAERWAAEWLKGQ